MRTRYLKPGFFENEDLAKLPPMAAGPRQSSRMSRIMVKWTRLGVQFDRKFAALVTFTIAPERACCTPKQRIGLACQGLFVTSRQTPEVT